MVETTVEQRLSALEREVADLKSSLRTSAADAPPSNRPNWLAAVCGSMKDVPEFDEVARLGQAIRRAGAAGDEGTPR